MASELCTHHDCHARPPVRRNCVSIREIVGPVWPGQVAECSSSTILCPSRNHSPFSEVPACFNGGVAKHLEAQDGDRDDDDDDDTVPLGLSVFPTETSQARRVRKEPLAG